MKDMERSRETIFKTFREGLIQKHPKALNIFLILALISLVIAGAFLLSDIMSFKSNADQKGPFGGLYLKMPKESQTIVKNWQEKGITLINQLKSILGMKEPVKAAVKDSTNKNKAQALLAKNRLAKAKEARTRTGNLSHRENSVVSPNSSRTLALVQPLMMTSSIMTGSGGSEGSSAKDIENNHLVVAVTSNISENQLNSNKSISNESVSNDSVFNESVVSESVSDESLLNEPVMNESSTNKPSISESALNESVVNESVSDESLLNEPVMNESSTNKSAISESALNESVSDESLLNEPVMNESVANRSAISESALNESVVNESQIRQSNTNQSEMRINLSSNTSNSLPATGQESNSTRNSSYPIVTRNTNLSFDNHSTGFIALQQSQTNFAASNSAEIHNNINQDKNGSSASAPPEFNNTNNEIHNQNETSNLKTNSDSTQDEKAKNESEGTMLNQRSNITSDALASSSKDIPPNSVPDKASNITPNQITKSLNPDSALTTGNTLLASDSASQLQEPKQNQTYNRNESKTLLDGSSISLPLPNNNTEELQNHAEQNTNTEKKKVSTSSASVKSRESKKGVTNRPNIRSLKVQTPSRMTGAVSKNKRK